MRFHKAGFDGGRGMVRGWARISVPYSQLGGSSLRLVSYLALVSTIFAHKQGGTFCRGRVTLADAACIYERCVFSGAWPASHQPWGPPFDLCLPEYEDFIGLVAESTKAANWLAEIVRREFNPMFFAMEGKFVVDYDCCGLNSIGVGGVYEFSDHEKALLPDAMLQSSGNVPGS